MANFKQHEIDQRLTTKWTAISNDVIKAVNYKYRSIVFVRTRLLNQYWVLLTVVFNPKTDGRLKEFDKRIPINEFMTADSNKIAATVCSAFEQMNTGN